MAAGEIVLTLEVRTSRWAPLVVLGCRVLSFLRVPGRQRLVEPLARWLLKRAEYRVVDRTGFGVWRNLFNN